MSDPNTALILHLQRLSTEDGPGIRTTIFFKGCPLHCPWCHNPESIPVYPQVQWLEVRCIGCDICLSVCPNQALSRATDGKLTIDRSQCEGCGCCAAECPANAMELLGTQISVKALADELSKDRSFFETSQGGITASGGEPTLQAEFVSKLFAHLQSEDIHTALDTCGACNFQALKSILPHTNLVLFDLKLMNEDAHRRATGQGNRRILSNLIKTAEMIRSGQSKAKLWIRTPLIPEISTSAENLQGIGAFIYENLDDLVDRWELCAFNNLCRDKYERLGMAWQFKDLPLMSETDLVQCKHFAQTSPFDPMRITVTGAAKPEASL